MIKIGYTVQYLGFYKLMYRTFNYRQKLLSHYLYLVALQTFHFSFFILKVLSASSNEVLHFTAIGPKKY